MSIDEPMDLEAVAADDALVERLRRSLSPQDAVVWGDDEDDSDDLSYALLHALQADVSGELPPSPPLPATVVPLASRRRALGRTAAVTALAAGVLSLAGASAAAATSSPGDPLYGMRSAVASAVQEVVDAITPSAPIGPVQADPAAAATPTATMTPPGAAVSAAARSASAVRQIQERLTTAGRLLDDRRPKAASQVLDQAERRLPLVLDPDVRKGLQDQIRALQARAAVLLATPPSPRPQPERSVEPRKDKDDNDRRAPDARKTSPKPERSAAANRGSGGSTEVEDGSETGESELEDRSGKAQVPDMAQDARDSRSGPGRRDTVDR